METPPQIVFKNLPTSEAMEARIREKIDRLERYHHEIIDCRVVVEEPHKSSARHNDPLGIAVEINVPGDKLVAKGGVEARQSENMNAVIRAVFESVERQLEAHASKQRDTARHTTGGRDTGRVTRLFASQRNGFVQIAGVTDLYFSEYELNGITFDELEEGSMVLITRSGVDGPMGPQASSVQAIGAENRMPRG